MPAPHERSKEMFRRLRYRKWLVAGLGLAALVVPTTALAGNNGYKDGWYGYAVAATKQAQQSQLLDGRSPDTKDAALAAQPTLDPAIVKYLERYGFTQSQIAAMSGGAFKASQPTLDPAIVKYLERYGFTQSQIAAMSGGAYKASQSKPTLDPATVNYLERYGVTQSQIAAMSGGTFKAQPTLVDGRSPDTIDFAAQAHSPVVTVTRSPGFQWDDFGVGLSAAMLALALIGIMRLVSSRSGHKP